jgi:hypothetical protein
MVSHRDGEEGRKTIMNKEQGMMKEEVREGTRDKVQGTREWKN